MRGWHVEFNMKQSSGKTSEKQHYSPGNAETKPLLPSTNQQQHTQHSSVSDSITGEPKNLVSLPIEVRNTFHASVEKVKPVPSNRLKSGSPDPFSIFIGLLGLFFCAIGLAPVGIWITFGRGKLLGKVFLLWLGGALLYFFAFLYLSTLVAISLTALIFPITLIVMAAALFIYAGILAAVSIMKALFGPARD